jgi:hypothetical protein
MVECAFIQNVSIEKEQVNSIIGYAENLLVLQTTEIEQGTFDNDGMNSASYNRVRSVKYIPVESGSIYSIKCVKATGQTKTPRIAISYYSSNDYSTARSSASNWSDEGEPLSVIIPSEASYIRMLFSYTNNANISPSNIAAVIIEKLTATQDYYLGSGFEKKGVTLAQIGYIKGGQSFCIYNGSFYSAFEA